MNAAAIAKKVASWKVSPSQVKTFRECQRKFAFVYVEGKVAPQNAAALLGSAVHELLENHYGNGEMVGDKAFRALPEIKQQLALNVAKSALPHYPPEVTYTEQKFVFDYQGITWRGYVDLVYPDPGWFPLFSEVEPGVIIADHKTSRDPGRWGLTSAELLTDEQFVIYTFWAFTKFAVNHVGGQWTYLRTQGKAKGLPIRQVVSKEHVEREMEPIVETGRRILEVLSNNTQANDLPPSLNACGNFGGCPFAEHCEVSQEQRLDRVFAADEEKVNEKEKENEMKSLKEMLADKKKKGSGPTNSKGQMAPPRARELRVVNSPEGQKTPEAEREVSKAVGTTITGNRERNKESAQRVSEAAIGTKTGEEARSKVEPVVERIEAEETARKSLSQDQILVRCYGGSGHQAQFTGSSKEATPEAPFVHGRTLNAMVKQDLLAYDKTGKSYFVTLSEAGVEKAEGLISKNETEPTFEVEEGADETTVETEPEAFDDEERDDDGDDRWNTWWKLVETTEGDPDKVERLFAHYCKHFS